MDRTEYRFQINKIEAAVIQLEAAFQLMIDSVYDEAAHTLIAAATDVIRNVSISKGHPYYSELFEPFEKSFAASGTKFWTAFKRPTNFLKHADKDPNDTLAGIDFVEDNENGFLIACHGLHDFFDELPERIAIAYGTCAFAQHSSGGGYDVIGHMKASGGDVQSAAAMMQLPRGELYRRAKIAWDEAKPTHPSTRHSE